MDNFDSLEHQIKTHLAALQQQAESYRRNSRLKKLPPADTAVNKLKQVANSGKLCVPQQVSHQPAK